MSRDDATPQEIRNSYEWTITDYITYLIGDEDLDLDTKAEVIVEAITKATLDTQTSKADANQLFTDVARQLKELIG